MLSSFRLSVHKILPSFFLDTCAMIAPIDRVDCGWPGVTKDQCLQIGCCFDSSVSHARYCFYKAGEVLRYVWFI